MVPEASEAVGPVSPQAVGDCRLIVRHLFSPRGKSQV